MRADHCLPSMYFRMQQEWNILKTFKYNVLFSYVFAISCLNVTVPLTSLAGSDSCFQCRRAHGIWKAWCISSTLYQSLASVEPIKGPPVGTVPENRMHPGMLDVFVQQKHLSYVHIQFLVVCTFWYVVNQISVPACRILLEYTLGSFQKGEK